MRMVIEKKAFKVIARLMAHPLREIQFLQQATSSLSRCQLWKLSKMKHDCVWKPISAFSSAAAVIGKAFHLITAFEVFQTCSWAPSRSPSKSNLAYKNSSPHWSWCQGSRIHQICRRSALHSAVEVKESKQWWLHLKLILQIHHSTCHITLYKEVALCQIKF